MVNISDTRKQKLIDEIVYNTLLIDFVDGTATITEDNITAESMKLKQSICDEQNLKFGGCIASEFTIEITNTQDRMFDSNSLVNKWINVRIIQTAPTGDYIYPNTIYPGSACPGETIGDTEFYVFSGYIDSVEKNKDDHNVFTITAYDVMAKLYAQDATNFLYKIFSVGISSVDHTNEFGNMFISLFNRTVNKVMDIEMDIPQSYFNEILNNGDAVKNIRMINNKWLEQDNTISFGEIFKYCCEMLGLFGFIFPSDNQGGVFKFIDPFNNIAIETYSFYEKFTVDEGNVNHSFNSINYKISNSSDGKTKNYCPGEEQVISDNIYDITDNIFVHELSSGEDHRFQTFFSGDSGKRITGYGTSDRSFYPATATLDGRLWVSVGDRIDIIKNRTDINGDYIYTKDDDGNYIYDDDGNLIITTELYTTYVLSRTLSGIQALTDEIQQ